MQELFERLEYAKKAVRTMLDKDGCSVDMHGLTYWAGEVERLRKEIKEKLWGNWYGMEPMGRRYYL